MLVGLQGLYQRSFDNVGIGGSSTPANPGVAVTGGNSADGTAVAWGAGALPFEGQLVIVDWSGGSANAADTRSLVDILIDRAGGTTWESTPFIPSLLAGFGAPAAPTRRIMLPVRVPAGSNLGVRARSLTTGRSHRVSIQVLGGSKVPGGQQVGQYVLAYGADRTTTYNGVLVTPGTSPTWSSFVNVGATLEAPAMAVALAYGGANGNTLDGHSITAQIGVGGIPLGEPSGGLGTGAGVFVSTNTSEAIIQYLGGFPYYCDLPAGTQMQVRARASLTPRASGFVVYVVH